jgi:hypothetical protein
MAIWKQAPDLERINAWSDNTLMQVLGIRFTAVGDDWLAGTMPVDTRTHQPFGLLHGGASVALAETLGSTGALLTLGRIKGIGRPALATIFPTGEGRLTMLLDVGANADCRPIHLFQFGHMGAAYMEKMFKVHSPKVGLLVLIMCAVALAISVRFTLISPVASAEAIGSIAIVKRCWNLTKGHYWRLLGLVALLLVAALALLMTAGVLGGLLARIVSPDIEPFSLAALIVSLLAGIAQGLFSVLASVMLARVYSALAGGGAEATVPSSGT